MDRDEEGVGHPSLDTATRECEIIQVTDWRVMIVFVYFLRTHARASVYGAGGKMSFGVGNLRIDVYTNVLCNGSRKRSSDIGTATLFSLKFLALYL